MDYHNFIIITFQDYSWRQKRTKNVKVKKFYANEKINIDRISIYFILCLFYMINILSLLFLSWSPSDIQNLSIKIQWSLLFSVGFFWKRHRKRTKYWIFQRNVKFLRNAEKNKKINSKIKNINSIKNKNENKDW